MHMLLSCLGVSNALAQDAGHWRLEKVDFGDALSRKTPDPARYEHSWSVTNGSVSYRLKGEAEQVGYFPTRYDRSGSVTWAPPPPRAEVGQVWNLTFRLEAFVGPTDVTEVMSTIGHVHSSLSLMAPSVEEQAQSVDRNLPPVDGRFEYKFPPFDGYQDRLHLTLQVAAGAAGSAAGSTWVSYDYRWTGPQQATTSDEMPPPPEVTTHTPPLVPSNWGLVVGGAGLAAVAAGLAGAYWKRRRASGDKSTKPPEGPVGYVLQLSHDRFTLQADESAALTITVWAVDHTGATSLASGASIAIVAPAGLVAAPAAGAGRLVTHLRATKELAAGAHTLAVSAQAGGSAYNASVVITAGVNYVYALELTPATINLQRDGRETVRARVKVTGPDPAQCERESQRLSAAITFTLTGSAVAWFSASDQSEGGSRAGTLELTIPPNASTLKGPHTATYTARVSTPTGNLAQACAITITTSESFELAMDRRLRLQANDVAGSLMATLRCLDDTITDAPALIAAATPRIRFTVEGQQSHWIREERGKPGVLTGERSSGETPAKEVHPLVEVPLADLSESPPFTATITASVEVPRYGSFTQVAAVDIAPPKWFVELQPIKDKLKVGMTDAAVFRVRVLPDDQQKLPLYMTGKVNALNQNVTFYADGTAQPYTYVGERETDGEFRVYEVQLRDVPKDADLGEYLDLVAEATLCGQTASQRFRINLSGRPTLEAAPKSVTLVNDGDPVELRLTVRNGDEFKWGLRLEVTGTGEVALDGPPDTDDGRRFTVALRAGEGPEGSGVRTGVFRVTAVTTNPETGEEVATDPVDVPLTVGQEGLAVSPNPVRLAADPKGPPATFKVRVVRFNASAKRFECDPTAMKALELGEWEDGEAPNGANVFTGAGVTLRFDHSEGSGLHQVAVWTAKAKLVIPAPEPIDVLRTLTAPGDWGDAADRFSVSHRFVAPVDAAAAAAERIRVEQERCRYVLGFMPPSELKDTFTRQVENDARMLDAAGLFRLRSAIWNEARKSLEEDAASYLWWSNRWDNVATFADWTSYVCDLTMQGIASVAIPFPGDLVVNVLYKATPEFINAVFNGESVEAWFKNWCYGFYEGLPGMGADMAIGMVVNLEDLVKKGLQQFRDLKKACLAACIVYWEARFFRYYAVPKPDGDPYSVRECIVNALRDLAEEIITTGIAKNARFHAENMKLPGPLGWVKDYDVTKGHGYDPKDGRVYHEGTKPPNTAGMPDPNLKSAQEIAKKHGVEIYVRPTNAASKKLLEQGALPKPESIKSKTINEVDLKLGRHPDDLGKVGYFDPQLPPQGTMTKTEYDAVKKRFVERKKEFLNNQADFKKLAHEHTVVRNGETVIERVTVEKNGVVMNHTTRVGPDGTPVTTTKPYTGDHDIYDIRGKNGRPLSPAEYDLIYQKLKDSRFQAQHPGHRQWDYTKPKQDPKAEKTRQEKYQKNKDIDEKIKDSHQSKKADGKEGESLIRVGADGKVTGVFHNPPKVSQTMGNRAGKAAAASQQRDERARKAP